MIDWETYPRMPSGPSKPPRANWAAPILWFATVKLPTVTESKYSSPSTHMGISDAIYLPQRMRRITYKDSGPIFNKLSNIYINVQERLKFLLHTMIVSVLFEVLEGTYGYEAFAPTQVFELPISTMRVTVPIP